MNYEKQKIRHYKNQLSSYGYWLNELTRVNDELKAIKRIIEEPKATQFGEKEMTGFSDDQSFKYQGVLEREERLIKLRREIEHNLMKCINLLNSIDEDVASMLYGMYVKGIPSMDVAIAHNYSRMGMHKRVEKELSNV